MEGHKSNQAKRTLQHYFRMIAKNAGVHWDSDNDAEVEEIIDNLMSEVDERIANAIENHKNGAV
jgi:hypothetical protein